MRVLANPDNISRAAKEIFKSAFHDDINLWQTKYVALTKRAWAESVTVIRIFNYKKHTKWTDFQIIILYIQWV